MTTATDASTPATSAPTTRPSGRARRPRRATAYAAVVGLGLVLVVLLALTAGRPADPLDPQSPGASGAMALVEVLRQQGVEVEVVRSISDLEASRPGRDTTVVVGDPTYLGQGATERLAEATGSAGRLVLVGVDSDQLDVLGLPVSAFPGVEVDLVARCSSSVALDSDVVWAVDTRYLVDEGADGVNTCFTLPDADSETGEPAPGGEYGSALVEVAATSTTPPTLLVGFGPGWSNRLIVEDRHAGTAVRALGSTPRLVWYHPGLADLDDGTTGEGPTVWPVWTTPAIVLLGVAVVTLALAAAAASAGSSPSPCPSSSAPSRPPRAAAGSTVEPATRRGPPPCCAPGRPTGWPDGSPFHGAPARPGSCPPCRAPPVTPPSRSLTSCSGRPHRTTRP